MLPVEKRRRLLGGWSHQVTNTPVTPTPDILTMFSRLPSQLSAPFGILGDEPKLAFRSQQGGIAKLASSRARNLNSVPFAELIIPLYATQDIPPTDSYWDQVSPLRVHLALRVT